MVIFITHKKSVDVAMVRPADIRAVLASYQSADITAEFIERSKEHQRSVDTFLCSITYFLYLVDGNLNVSRQYYAVVTLYSLLSSSSYKMFYNLEWMEYFLVSVQYNR